MFRVTVKNSNSKWTEDYPCYVRSYDLTVTDQISAETMGQAIVQRFNNTLRPGEKPREFVKAEYLGPDDEIHDS